MFVQMLRMGGVNCSVATNGLLLTPTQIDILTSNLTWLRFNISAVNKYDMVMGAPPNSFKKFEKIIKLSLENKKQCTIGLQMVLIPDCFDEIIPLAKKAVEWGVDYLVIKQFSDGGEGMPMHFDMGKYEEARHALQEAEKMSNDRTKIISKWSAIQDTINITNDLSWGFDRCIDLPLLFQISGNGKCYPCGYFFGNSEYCYGDLNTTRLCDILKSERYWEVIKKVAETPLQQLCRGQCRHCETNKFVDKLVKLYSKGYTLEDSLTSMCGSVEQYTHLINNPPEHINFI
jgi:radical SAM protein with 4Fe4S-binding SPASM domain